MILLMKKLFFVYLMLTLGINAGFSQSNIGSMTTGTQINVVKKEVDSKVVVEQKNKTRKERFEELKMSPKDLKSRRKVRCLSDRTYVKKGECVRIKYVFNPIGVTEMSVVNAPSSNPKTTNKDIRKGEWIAVVKPEKTMTISVMIMMKEVSIPTFDKSFVLVLDPDKYAEVDAKRREFEANNDKKGWMEYYWNFAGKDGQIYKERLFDTTNP